MPSCLRLAPALALLVACAGEPGEGEAASEATGAATAMTQTTSATASESESAGETTSASTSTATATTTPGDACPPPLAICDDACVDLDHDPEHCGACESPCDPGLACLAGACGPACGPAATRCGDACVDVDHDPAHCGGCDHACAADTPCIAGACVPSCGAAEIACGEACVDAMADEAHCGGCDNTCPMGQPCVYGRCVEAALHHLLISGQSLSNGHSSQVLSDTQPFSNLSFNPGVRAGAQNLTSMIPLVETWDGARGETIASGLANTVAAMAPEHVILASAHGADGTAYSGVKKGTGPYAAGIAQVTAGFTLAEMQGLPYAVRALAILHGESDHLAGNLAYAENLLAWQSDVEADVQVITGQLHPVPLFLCQMSSFTRLGNSSTSKIPAAQLAAARARPDRIYVVGPKYIFPYVDGVHLSGEGTRWLGEYYAKAYERVLLDGQPWRPLAPASITREGAVITVDFEVPAPPLVLDTDLVSDPGNFGFEFFDSSGAPPTIAEVALTGPTTVQITLSGPPIAGDRRLRYAYTGAPGALAGPTTGARGNLRDSDPRVGASGMPLHNWAVHFDEPVP